MGLYFLVITLLLGTFEKSDKTDVDYVNLGNAMVAYQELPFAVYYYTKALELNPENQVAKEERIKIWQQLGINAQQELRPFSLPWIPLYLILLLLASLWIWWKRRWVMQLILFALFILVLLPLFYFLEQGLIPLNGVVVKPTLLYTEGKEGASVVDSIPLKGGELLQVVGISENRKWIRVYTSEGNFGFIPSSTTRV